jgi:hypothetical protein
MPTRIEKLEFIIHNFLYRDRDVDVTLHPKSSEDKVICCSCSGRYVDIDDLYDKLLKNPDYQETTFEEAIGWNEKNDTYDHD